MDSALRVAVDERLIIRLPHRTLLFVLFVIVVVDSLRQLWQTFNIEPH